MKVYIIFGVRIGDKYIEKIYNNAPNGKVLDDIKVNVVKKIIDDFSSDIKKALDEAIATGEIK